MEIDDRWSAAVPRDIAKELGPDGIRKLLVIMTDAYRDLCGKRLIAADSVEDQITEEWHICVQKRCMTENAFGLSPIPQKRDTHKAKRRGRPPTIDFCFRDEFDEQSYFGAECKLMDQGSKRHLNAYLDADEGIGRFLGGKYAAYASAGAMVGYVRQGDCNAVAADIARGMKHLDGTPRLKEAPPLPPFDQLYQSKHTKHADGSPFECFHLLFAFNCSAA